MREPLIRLSCLLSLMIASPVSAVNISWVPVGNAGNDCQIQYEYYFNGEPQNPVCFGTVDHSYFISKYEITNAQYTEFLNAKAASDPLGLYNPNMADGDPIYDVAGGGITRRGADGSYTYSAIAGRENRPVNWVSFFDAIRFANWMNNGQGDGDTEMGAYTLLGGTAVPSNSATVMRNPDANIVLASADEWYKAAYYDPSTSSYFDYPTRSDTLICSGRSSLPQRANCGNVSPGPHDVLPVGSYPGSASPYGTFDQAGNVYEWTESFAKYYSVTDRRAIRGGPFNQPDYYNGGWAWIGPTVEYDNHNLGFRLVTTPEPGSGLLVLAGLLGLAGWSQRARVG